MKMQNRLETLGFPMIKLCGRREIKNLKSLEIFTNGVALNCSTGTKEKITNEKGQKITIANIFKTKDIIIGDTLSTEENNNILTKSFSLGEFVNNNTDIIKDFAKCYLIYKNIEHINNVMMSNSSINKNNIKYYKLTDNYKNLNIEELNIDYDYYYEHKIPVPKYAQNEELKRLLINWLKVCGLSDNDIINNNTNITIFENEEKDLLSYIEEKKKKGEYTEEIKKETKTRLKNIKKTIKFIKSRPFILTIESLLKILDVSLEIYKMYSNYLKNNCFNIDYFTFSGSINYKDNIFKLNQYTTDIFSLISLMILAYIKSDLNRTTKDLKRCQCCNELFLGRKNKLYCNLSCKNRNKYCKRKEKQRSDTKCRI